MQPGSGPGFMRPFGLVSVGSRSRSASGFPAPNAPVPRCRRSFIRRSDDVHRRSRGTGRRSGIFSQPAVEGLGEGIVGGLSRPGEVELELVEIGPSVGQPPGELRAIARREEALFSGYCHAHLAADLAGARVGLRLPQRERDLLIRNSFLRYPGAILES